MAAEHYEPHTYPRPENEFGPTYFHAPAETLKPRKVNHLRLVGHTAVTSEGVGEPVETYPHPFRLDTTQEEDAAELRRVRQEMAEDEQKAMDAFRVNVTELKAVAAKQPGEAIVRLGIGVVEAPAFKERRVEVDGEGQVDFMDHGVAAVKIIEQDDGHVVIEDKMTFDDRYRTIVVSAEKGDPESVEVAIIDGQHPAQLVEDSKDRKRFVTNVIDHVGAIVEKADATDNQRARSVALASYRVPFGRKWSADERAHMEQGIPDMSDPIRREAAIRQVNDALKSSRNL